MGQTERSVYYEQDDRGRRCLCGHYKAEHRSDGLHSSCQGACATLMMDADDHESVEVHCPCDHFYEVEPGYHEVRR